MKKSLIYILSFLLVSNVFSAPKETGWEKDGLKGKVKESICTEYAIKNKLGEQVKVITGKTITAYNAEGNQTEATTYDANGKFLVKFILKYDAKGNNIEWVSNSAEGTYNCKITYTYDDNGNMIDSTSYWGADQTLKSIYKHDPKGNLIERSNYGNTGSLLSKTVSKYDNFSREAETEEYDDHGLKRKLLYKYDNGKLIEIIETEPNGDLISKMVFKYDDKGNRLESETFNADKALTGASKFSYIYYPND
ncbi:MAG: hypothetical protein WAX69_06905 [Victivallales bacterium]